MTEINFYGLIMNTITMTGLKMIVLPILCLQTMSLQIMV